MLVDKVGRIHPPKNDGDIHIAGRSTDLGLLLVAEIMNAKEEAPAIQALRGAEGAATPVTLTGAWRVWFERAGDTAHVQGGRLEPATTSNPHHLFEIHPVTRVGEIDVSRSLRPIEGFEPKSAEVAFVRFESLPCELDATPTTTTIKSSMAAYNYVEFVLEVNSTEEVEDGWIVLAKVRDLAGELVVNSCRMVFVKGTTPAQKAKDFQTGKHLRVIGMPRIDLAQVHWRVNNSARNPKLMNGSLPYEMVIVGLVD